MALSKIRKRKIEEKHILLVGHNFNRIVWSIGPCVGDLLELLEIMAKIVATYKKAYHSCAAIEVFHLNLIQTDNSFVISH